MKDKVMANMSTKETTPDTGWDLKGLHKALQAAWDELEGDPDAALNAIANLIKAEVDRLGHMPDSITTLLLYHIKISPISEQRKRDFWQVLHTYRSPTKHCAVYPLPVEKDTKDDQQVTADQPDPESEVSPGPQVASDPEMGRLAVALDFAAQYRMWLVMLDHVRSSNKAAPAAGITYIERKVLIQSLKQQGIQCSRQYLHRLLKQGQGVFWRRIDSGGRIFFMGQGAVAAQLTQLAFDAQRPGLVGPVDRPGKRAWYVPIRGSLRQFKAHLYAAWLASRDGVTIARQTLETLWNCSQKTLREWERLSGVEVLSNYAQSIQVNDPRIPLFAYAASILSLKHGFVQGWMWRLANTYLAPAGLRSRNHKGQARRIRQAVNAVCDSRQSPGHVAGVHRLSVSYREVDWSDRQSLRRLLPDNKKLHYLKIGERHKRCNREPIGIFELNASREIRAATRAYRFRTITPMVKRSAVM